MPAVPRLRDGDAESTRAAILAAAELLLASDGDLSIRELCARAGVTAPTVYHHFGDKQALVDRIVDDCFAAFDATLARRTPPADPADAFRWAFDRYVEYGRAHPAHYRLMFQRRAPGRPPSGVASYDRLRRMLTAIADAGRLAVPVEPATRACWSAAHGVTSLVVGGHLGADDPALALVREALIARLIRPARRAPGRRAK